MIIQGLQVMLLGYVGIFLVMSVIALTVFVLNRFSKGDQAE
jgi:uncharacterized membrane protein YbaN (DUF454 family)